MAFMSALASNVLISMPKSKPHGVRLDNFGGEKMAENQDQITQSGMPGWMVATVVVLAIVSIVGVGLAWNDSVRMQDMQQTMVSQIKAVQQDAAQQTKTLQTLQEKEGQAEATNTALQSDLGVVTKRLRLTQGQLQKARDEAAQIRDEAQQKIEEVDSNVRSELATKASNDDLSTVNGNVSAVKTDLEGTKNDLKMARSELGTLIARNHDEVDALRRLGERDYIEFTIQARNKPQKVGNITVELRSVNTKKNQFNVALTVDDLRTERKNRAVDEPIIFYPRGSHQADELVVNSVGKNKITGYISIPKSAGTTTASSD
jgi:hypothetical protein